MFLVSLSNNNIKTPIHNQKEKLKSGTVVQGINTIDSFSFVILPSNKGFNSIFDFTTLVEVYNLNKKRYEFQGRVLCSYPEMNESGLISKTVTCESFLGYLCDSQQPYIEEANWTVRGFLVHVIGEHNKQVEDYKKFTIGEITVTAPNDNLYVGIQRENTWKTIQDKLIEKLGGEIRFRAVDDVIYIDYLEKIGTTRSTTIEMSKNMKSITKEVDPSEFITRLIPLGCKLSKEETSIDDEGNITTQVVETEERLSIAGVNGGKNYIDFAAGIEMYGIHVGYVIYDDVTTETNLLAKGQKWVEDNGRVQVKYSIKALDLSLIGLDIDDFEVYNYHPIVNPLLGINDTARIIKKTIDVCEEVLSSFEIGDNFKTMTEVQLDQKKEFENISNSVQKVQSTTNNLKNYVSSVKTGLNDRADSVNEVIIEETTKMTNNCEEIIFEALKSYAEKGDYESFKETVESQLKILSDQISLNFTKTVEELNTVNGTLQSQLNTITAHFLFDIDGFTIGRSDSPYKIVISHNKQTTYANDVEVQIIDAATGEVLTPKMTVTERFNLFGYVIEPDASGNINCDYIGNYTTTDKEDDKDSENGTTSEGGDS